MKVFLDDYRETPTGWVRAFWPDEIVRLLETGNVTHLSLDHDLGDDRRGTGYDVLPVIERMIHSGELKQLPEIIAHTSNPAAKQKVELAITAIKRQWAMRNTKNQTKNGDEL